MSRLTRQRHIPMIGPNANAPIDRLYGYDKKAACRAQLKPRSGALRRKWIFRP
jgi:hypothetical protein